jgi:phage-related protein
MQQERLPRVAAGRDQDTASFRDARLEAGVLLRRLQKGEVLSMPRSRAMRSIGPCCELRIRDRDQTWRIIYRIDPDTIVIVDVFSKKTRQTAVSVIENCQRRLKGYDRIR